MITKDYKEMCDNRETNYTADDLRYFTYWCVVSWYAEQRGIWDKWM